MSTTKPSAVTAVDHLIAADVALMQLRRLATQAKLGLHAQDLHQWIEQLRDRLAALDDEGILK